MPYLLLFILMILASPASATSMEDVDLATGTSLLQQEEATDEPAEELPEPQLSEAYSSLYYTLESRRKNEGTALAMGVLGGLAGYLGGAVGAFITFGIGTLGLPAAVAVGAAYGVHPFFDARFGWEVAGALVGTTAAVVLAWGAGFFAAVARNSGLVTTSVMFGLVVMGIGPGIGAWVAGITDQDNLERQRLEVALGPNSVGLQIRF